MNNVLDGVYSGIAEFNNTMQKLKKKQSNEEVKGILYNSLRRNLPFSSKLTLTMKNVEFLMDENALSEVSFKDIYYNKCGELNGISIKCKGAKTREMLEILNIVNSIK